MGDDGSRERSRVEEVVRRLIRPAIGGTFEVTPCYELAGHEIAAELSQRIRRDALLIADVSEPNQNVAFEVGMRHAVRLGTCGAIAAGA
jgi:hypothetical protein